MNLNCLPAESIVNVSKYMVSELDFQIDGYCEPFCGMLGVYRHVPKLWGKDGESTAEKGGGRNYL